MIEGPGSRKPKNIRILRIRIWIPNTAESFSGEKKMNVMFPNSNKRHVGSDSAPKTDKGTEWNGKCRMKGKITRGSVEI
jgi:hypothetical protein